MGGIHVTDETTRDLAYHWAPSARRKGIERRGLVPGSRSRDQQWRPPFVCLSRNPAYAIASTNAQVPVAESMDLWMLDLAELPIPREEFDWHDEMRFYERIPARYLTYLGSREASP